MKIKKYQNPFGKLIKKGKRRIETLQKEAKEAIDSKPKPRNWNVTPFGYIHPTKGYTVKDIRETAYRNIDPFGYTNDDGDSPTKRIINGVLLDIKERQIKENGYNPYVDDFWATYLKIPESKRHNIPGKSKLERRTNGTYRIKNLPMEAQEDLIRSMQGYYPEFYEDGSPYEVPPMKIGERRIINIPAMELDNPFRTFTIGRGYDKEIGDYVDYFDRFDLAPYGSGKGDQSFGIGKPFITTDRIPLNKYYGVDPHNTGLYLPEVEVTGRIKHKRKRNGKFK